MSPFDLWTYFRLSGTKRLTVFENGADNQITDVTAGRLARLWKSGKEGIRETIGRGEEISKEQSEN